MLNSRSSQRTKEEGKDISPALETSKVDDGELPWQDATAGRGYEKTRNTFENYFGNFASIIERALKESE